MKKKLIIFFFILSLYSCINYNSDNYIKTENEAIIQIIPQLIDLDRFTNKNNSNKKLKLYLASTLNTEIYDINQQYKGHIINKLDETSKFSKLLDGTIKERKLNLQVKYQNLEVKLVSINIKFNNNKLKESELGYLFISRIIFNKELNIGYLSYYYFCGSACARSNNIEISKINGKWTVSNTFSGGIA